MISMMEAIEPGAGSSYVRWMADARSALDAGLENFIQRDFDGWGSFLDISRLLPLLRTVNPVKLLAPHRKQLEEYCPLPSAGS